METPLKRSRKEKKRSKKKASDLGIGRDEKEKAHKCKRDIDAKKESPAEKKGKQK